MRSVLIVAVAFLLVVTISGAMAESFVSVWEDEATGISGTSSWYGNTGMILTPTAAMPGVGGASAQYHRIQRDAEDVNVWGVNVGVTQWLEAGGTHVDVPGADSEVIGNAKIKIPAAKWLDNPVFPDVAAGVFDLTNELNRTYYLVLSKAVPLTGIGPLPRINLHFGYADNDTDSGALDGFFGGLEFNILRYGLVQAEYDGDAFNANLRYNATNRLSVDLGFLDGDLGYGATYRSQF